MLRTLGAARASSKLRRGRVQPVEADPSPPPLPLTRATVIRPRPFDDEGAAAEWLKRVSGDRELWTALAVEAAHCLNRALHAHRTAAGDPHVADVDPARAAAIRFGFGTGDELAEGRWREARELAASERQRLVRRDSEALRPQERIAAVLGGRERIGAYEELILRARGDLDAGRLATAALGLHSGLEAMADLGALPADPALAERIAEARTIARTARERTVRGDELEKRELEVALRAAEAALRRRALG